MKNNPKVSIIVPVYNVEDYIDKCIESILNQTYKNFELILVNDGSTDSSFKHLLKYKNDSRITIIDKPNTGQSDSRYRGLLVAKGYYVLFVDSDDTMATNTLDTYIDNSQNGNADVVFARYQLIDETGKKLRVQSKYTVNKYEDRFSILKDALCFKNFKASLCIKIIKREILLNAYNDEVRQIRINEDLLLSLYIANLCTSIYFSNKVVYNVLQRNNSLSRNIKPDIITILKKIYSSIRDLLEKDKIYDLIEKEYYYGYSKSILYCLGICAQKANNIKLFNKVTDSLQTNSLLGRREYICNKAIFPKLYLLMSFAVEHKKIYYFVIKALRLILKY